MAYYTRPYLTFVVYDNGINVIGELTSIGFYRDWSALLTAFAHLNGNFPLYVRRNTGIYLPR